MIIILSNKRKYAAAEVGGVEEEEEGREGDTGMTTAPPRDSLLSRSVYTSLSIEKKIRTGWFEKEIRVGRSIDRPGQRLIKHRFRYPNSQSRFRPKFPKDRSRIASRGRRERGERREREREREREDMRERERKYEREKI